MCLGLVAKMFLTVYPAKKLASKKIPVEHFDTVRDGISTYFIWLFLNDKTGPKVLEPTPAQGEQLLQVNIASY